MTKIVRRTLATTAMAVLLLAVAPSASASNKPGDPLQPCIDVALKQKADQWVCFGNDLTTISRDSNGKLRTHTVPVPGMAPTHDPLPAPITPLADDYDYWCENGSICHRYPYSGNKYITETKGNAAYGDRSGAIGAYDVILRTNLSGRQARWNLSLIWDLGPDISFWSDYVRCWEEIAVLPDVNCGRHPTGSATIRSNSWRYNHPLIHGNYLANSNEYYADFYTRFTADDDDYLAAPLNSLAFSCYGTANDYCTFP